MSEALDWLFWKVNEKGKIAQRFRTLIAGPMIVVPGGNLPPLRFDRSCYGMPVALPVARFCPWVLAHLRETVDVDDD